MAVWSKACTVLNHSNTGIVGLNSTEGMGVCIFCVVLSCVGSGFVTGWSPIQAILLNVQKHIHKFQKSYSESEKTRGPNLNLLHTSNVNLILMEKWAVVKILKLDK